MSDHDVEGFRIELCGVCATTLRRDRRSFRWSCILRHHPEGQGDLEHPAQPRRCERELAGERTRDKFAASRGPAIVHGRCNRFIIPSIYLAVVAICSRV